MNTDTHLVRLLHSIARFGLVALFLVLLALVAAPATAADRDFKINTLHVTPTANGNGTNVARFVNKGGTNWIGIDPTNGNFYLRNNGTNFIAITQTNTLWITNGGVAYPIKIRNGLIVY